MYFIYYTAFMRTNIPINKYVYILIINETNKHEMVVSNENENYLLKIIVNTYS
jgi:hypothetical protein